MNIIFNSLITFIMRNLGDKDNVVWIENIFSFENNEYKDSKEFEEIDKENYEGELYYSLE